MHITSHRHCRYDMTCKFNDWCTSVSMRMRWQGRIKAGRGKGMAGRTNWQASTTPCHGDNDSIMYMMSCHCCNATEGEVMQDEGKGDGLPDNMRGRVHDTTMMLVQCTQWHTNIVVVMDVTKSGVVQEWELRRWLDNGQGRGGLGHSDTATHIAQAWVKESEGDKDKRNGGKGWPRWQGDNYNSVVMESLSSGETGEEGEARMLGDVMTHSRWCKLCDMSVTTRALKWAGAYSTQDSDGDRMRVSTEATLANMYSKHYCLFIFLIGCIPVC